MPRERKPCKGIFRGLIIGRTNQNSGPYPAIKNGECKVIEYIEQSDRPELVVLERDVANAFIQADICQFDSREKMEKYMEIPINNE
ncbi:hypothetical protein [Pelosinus propionicus]|uniref:Uncharacterized protein n=1 Tax=Pelosinus propionicus DSM 13327 TaxID=1123291 RepID=A0A1I4K3N0_9FIRM|nr:hypothetical protein [Pelosinus propionicus]SFL73378.1 hypothetical protein SAMN04490355_101599 [Pelosinus propionicus DSM 13327]